MPSTNHSDKFDSLTNEEVLRLFKTDLISGLDSDKVEEYHSKFGFNEVTEKKKFPVLQFLKKFWGLTAWMLELIIILSWLLGKRTDAYVVGSLLLFNAIIGFYQEQNAEKAVEALKKELEINAKVLRNGSWISTPARELVPGDIIRVRKGDFVPADIKIFDGILQVDQSALTGESLETEKISGGVLFSGSVVTNGEATGIVLRIGGDTYFGRTVQLVEIAKPKLHIETIISQVVKALLSIVITLLAVAFGIAFTRGTNPIDILPLMLVLLLGAIPVALPAMFTVSMALASKELVKQGVLVTRLSAPDDAAQMDVICLDKTGTITLNKLSVAESYPVNGISNEDVLLYGALASQEANHDAIDLAILAAAKKQKVSTAGFTQISFSPFDAKTRRTEAQVKTGAVTLHVMKGAFEVITRLCKMDSEQRQNLDQLVSAFADDGYRTLAVAKGKSIESLELVGVIALHDPTRSDSKKMIRELNELGVTVKMLTGDAIPIAKRIAKAVGIGDRSANIQQLKASESNNSENITDLIEKTDIFAEVYPEDKYFIVKDLQARKHFVGMTGDGVNDAPALKQAEVGIAVSTATDVAKGAASIVLTKEGLTNITAPIKIGRMMFERINTWVLNKITRTILKTCFVVFSYLFLGKFVVSASAMFIMIFLTDFMKISLSTDNVRFTQKPSKWDMNGLVKVSILLGLVMTIEAIALLYIGIQIFKLDINNGEISTFTFQILFFFAMFSIFVLREKKHFWSSIPSKTVLFIVLGDIIFAIYITTLGYLGFVPLPINITAWVIGYILVLSLAINDTLKFFLLKWLKITNDQTKD